MTPKNMDPNLRARIEALLAKGVAQTDIADAAGVTRQLVSQLNVLRKKKEAAENPPPDPVTREEVLEENYQDSLRRRLRKAIPIKARVQAITQLVESGNPQQQKFGLEQLNLIEGMGKGDNKPYEPGPLFIVDTIPDLRPVRRPIDADEEEAGGKAQA